jgi:hypothetical protein
MVPTPNQITTTRYGKLPMKIDIPDCFTPSIGEPGSEKDKYANKATTSNPNRTSKAPKIFIQVIGFLSFGYFFKRLFKFTAP